MKTTPLLALVIAVLCFNLIEARTDHTLLQRRYEEYVTQTDSIIEELHNKISVSDKEYIDEFTITYYDACLECCGKTDGITKSGAKVCEGVTVAVDPSVIPLGEYIYIDGIGYRVAQDIGGAIKGNHIDVYVHSHKQAQELGTKTAKVWRMMK